MEAITRALSRYFDDEDPAALDEACRLAATTRFDLDALLAWLRDAPADEAPKDLATRRIRATLGLRSIPGPVCKPMQWDAKGRATKR